MSWERLKKRSGRSRDPNSIGFSIFGKFVTFSLGDGLLQRLRWEAGQRVEVMLGRDGDAGKVRLIAGGRGPADYKLMIGKERALLRPRRWPGLAAEFAMRDMPYTDIDGGIEIAMPAEALAPNAARPVPMKRTLADDQPSAEPVRAAVSAPRQPPATAAAARAIEASDFIKPPTAAQRMGRR